MRSILAALMLGTATVAVAQGASVRTGYVTTLDGARLFYKVMGTAPDTLIAIHGGPGVDLESMAADFAPLAQRHTVIFYDQRGAGRSTLPADTSRLNAAQQINDLDAVRARFGITRATLIAWSYGPLLAATYALAHPERVRRMIFLGPVPPRLGDFWQRFARNSAPRMDSTVQRQAADAMRRLTAATSDADIVSACRDYWKAGMVPRLADGARAIPLVKSDLCSSDPRGIKYGLLTANGPVMNSYGNWDLRAALKSLRVPTLVVHGEAEAIPMDLVEEWVTSLPMAKLVKVPRAAHFPFAERPDVVWPAVEKFLAGGNADWPVYQGNTDHTHYTTLSQISPKNVRQLQVAWTYETKDEFAGSEMQANPVVIDGVLYATTPKLQVFALEAATGRQLWRFDPANGAPPPSRFRHRGVVVTGDRVIFNYRNRLYALDRTTGRPIRTFGDSGWVDLRAGLGRPVEGLSVSASTPGVVFEDLFIIGSTVPEALPSAPGDIRAYDVKTGALRWSFHTIPHPGEYGYETWPAEAWKVAGGANAWSGVTLDPARAMVFAATGSASFDFYGANRLGDNLFANTVLALDARTGKRIWHFQGLRHDLWDRDFPAAPALVTVQRDGRMVDAVAQITKTGHVYLFNRDTGVPLFPVKEVAMPGNTLDGDRASKTQPFPVLPPPFARQQLTEAGLTNRTPAARAAALKTFREYATPHPFSPPNLKGRIIFPGVDGGGEWGGPAFDPQTGLLYVNSNEMAWLLKMVPRSDESIYAATCAQCHGTNRQGSATAPALEGIGQRKSRDEIAKIIREGTGKMSAFGAMFDAATIGDLVNFLVTGEDIKRTAGTNPFYLKYRSVGFDIFTDHEGYPGIKPPWGTLNAIDLNRGTIRWRIPFGEYPKLKAQGLRNTGTDNYGGAIVTENGLLIIAATTYDNKIRAYDKANGRLLWEAKLPAAGNATPSTYMVDGRQFLVIACGGGKNGAPSGGTYVAFALPAAP